MGLIDIDQFEEKFYSRFKINEGNKNNLRNIWFNSYCPHNGMRKIVEELSEKYRIIIFSGNVKERIQFLDEKYDFLKYFDDFVFSYDYQKNKHEKEFYEILLKYLDCTPSEAILIDDEKKSIKFAKSFGINTIYFCYPNQLITDLKNYDIHLNILI